jgi:excisionase family DNA binding protein
MIPDAKPKYRTVEYVAEILSCSKAHIYRLIIDGQLDAIKIGSNGREYRISDQSLNDFISKNKVNPEDLFDPDLEEKKTPAPPRPAAKSLWMSK